MPRPMRSCTKKTPIPKRLLEDTASLGEGSSDGGKKMEVTSPRERNTPRRLVQTVYMGERFQDYS